MFKAIYDKVLTWARHKHADYYLGGLSFSEAIFFPIPPDVMLAPMALSKPDRAWRYAFITTITSLIGGAIGYYLGYAFFEPIVQPALEKFGYMDKFEQTTVWFEQWGIWVVFLAGFTPIPYKVFTITAGFFQMLFLPFILASAVGRGARFFLVAGLMKWGGARMESKLREYIDYLGWGTIILAVVLYLIYR